MKKILFAMLVAGLCLASQSSQALTLNVSSGVLYNGDNTSTPMPDNGVLMLIASKSNSTFGDLDLALPSRASATAFVTEADDVIVDKWSLGGLAGNGLSGTDEHTTIFNLGDFGGVNAGALLKLVWYPTLALADTADNAPGFDVPFGSYRDATFVVPNGNGDVVDIALNTSAYFGGPLSNDEGRANQLTEAAAIPEPATGLLVAMSALSLVGLFRRRK